MVFGAAVQEPLVRINLTKVAPLVMARSGEAWRVARSEKLAGLPHPTTPMDT